MYAKKVVKSILKIQLRFGVDFLHIRGRFTWILPYLVDTRYQDTWAALSGT